MGYLSVGRCYPSPQEAAQSACSGYPVVATAASGVVQTACVGVFPDGSRLSLQRSYSWSTATEDQTLGVSFSTCDDLAEYSDLTMLFGLCLVGGLAVTLMRNFVVKLLANQ